MSTPYVEVCVVAGKTIKVCYIVFQSRITQYNETMGVLNVSMVFDITVDKTNNRHFKK